MAWQIIDSATLATGFSGAGIATGLISIPVAGIGTILVLCTQGIGNIIAQPTTSGVTWSLGTSILTQYTTASQMNAYYGIVNSTSGTGIAYTYSGGTSGAVLGAIYAAITGGNITTPIDVVTANNQAVVTNTIITVVSSIATTTVSNDLILCFLSDEGSGPGITVNNAWNNSFIQTKVLNSSGAAVNNAIGLATLVATNPGSYLTQNTFAQGASVAQYGASIMLAFLASVSVVNTLLINNVRRRNSSSFIM